MNARRLSLLAAALAAAAVASAAPTEVAPPPAPLEAAALTLHAAVSAALPGALPQAAIPGADAAAASAVAVPAQAAAPSAIETLSAQAAGTQAAARPGQPAQGGAAAAGAAFDGTATPSAANLGAQDLPALNAAMIEALKPYNNATTKASIVFRQVETDAERATAAAARVSYSKQGSQSFATLSIPAAYSNVDGQPRSVARATLSFDLLRAYPQSEFNRMGPGADKFVAQILEQYHRGYGAAATIDARKTREIHDPKTGDLQDVRVRVDLKIDLAKLPPTVKRESVQYLEGHLDFDMSLNGVRASIDVEHNPEYSSFKQGETGLKELLESLRAGKPETLQTVTKLMGYVDAAATQIVDSPRKAAAPAAAPATALTLQAAPAAAAPAAATAAPDYPRTAWIEALKQKYVEGHPATDEVAARSQLPAAARRAYDREHRARRRNGRRGQEVRAFVLEANGQKAFAVEAPGRRESHGYTAVDLFDAKGKLVVSGVGREGAPMSWNYVFDRQAWIEAVQKTFKDEYDQTNDLSFPTAASSEQPKAVKLQARRYVRTYGGASVVYRVAVDGRKAFIVYNQNGGGMWVKLFGPRGAELAEGEQGESGDFRW